MKNLYTKESMKINFNNKNKRAIAYKKKKEKLIFASLMNEFKHQITF